MRWLNDKPIMKKWQFWAATIPTTLFVACLAYDLTHTAHGFLDYFKVILSLPVVAGICFLAFMFKFGNSITKLIDRIKGWKGPGHEVDLEPQPALPEPPPTAEDNEDSSETESAVMLEIINDFDKQNKDLQQQKEELVKQSLHWEFQYLNHFLVFNTQAILDVIKQFGPITHAQLRNMIPADSELKAVQEALIGHGLIKFLPDGNITTTLKGEHYFHLQRPSGLARVLRVMELNQMKDGNSAAIDALGKNTTAPPSDKAIPTIGGASGEARKQAIKVDEP